MSQPETREQLTADIRRHYDALSAFYRLFWGPHIHHGYWEGDESPAEAQVRLMERLAARLEIGPGHRVLDIGCGLGGASCWLAETFGCSVLGLTLSPVQAIAARKRAAAASVTDLASFQVCDANRLNLPAETFDRIWIVECSEHLHDKEAFFRNCAGLLRPGGRLGLCVWLRGQTGATSHEGLVAEVCQAMLCPSLLTMEEQVSMLDRAGFGAIQADDVTAHVLPTWEHCQRLMDRRLVQLILRAKGGKLRRFVDSFQLMDEGYRSGAMAYGMLTATRDPGPQEA
jgi:tocopherol O-methyltransferase